MPRNNTTGVFTRVSNSFSNPVYGTVIDPTGADALFNDYDQGLTYAPGASVFTGTVGGTASAITLDTGYGLSALADGMEFNFTPTGTVNGALPTLAVDLVAAKDIKSVDGYSYSTYFNIQSGKPLKLRYVSSLDVFTIISPPTQWEDTPFGHGTCKLQASASDSLSLSQDDGQGLLMWNATTSAFRMVRISSITASGLFSANTTYVDGVAAQNLSANQLYAIYVNNTDATNQNLNRLEFWSFYSGVGVAAWGPVINSIGVYVKPTTAGGSTADNTRTYVGAVWTGTSDITNVVSPAATMGNAVYSHFSKSRWTFGYQTTVVTNNASSSSLTTQSTPAIGSVTEGISDSPRYDAEAVVTCDTAGAVASFRISLTGTTFDGSAFTATSPTVQGTSPAAGVPITLRCSWESAPPIGRYLAKTDIAVDVGTATFATDILGHLGQ